MKTFIMLLAVAFAVLSVDVASAAPDREAKREATSWVNKDLKNLKEVLKILKKIKDEKSAEAGNKLVLEVYGLGEDQDSSLGSAGPSSPPSGEEMDAVLLKNKKAYDKLQKAIEKEMERIATKVSKTALDECRDLIIFPEMPEEDDSVDSESEDGDDADAKSSKGKKSKKAKKDTGDFDFSAF